MRALLLVLLLSACHPQMAKPKLDPEPSAKVSVTVWTPPPAEVQKEVPQVAVPKSCMAPPPDLPIPVLPTNRDLHGAALVSGPELDIIDEWLHTYEIYVKEQFAKCGNPNLPAYALPTPEDPLMPEVPVMVPVTGPFDTLPPDNQPPY